MKEGLIMKKYKTSMKAIKENNSKVINIGYCAAQNLLRFNEATAYSSGTYGWNCDFHQIEPNTVIATGYRTNSKLVEYTIVEKYDNLAAEIIGDKTISWDDKKIQVNNLLERFVKEV
jgi:hypothetical protein